MTKMTVRRGPEFSRILGLGVARGENLVTNDDVAGPIESSDEWIRQRTGMVTRVRAAADTSLTLRAISSVVADCSSTAAAMVR